MQSINNEFFLVFNRYHRCVNEAIDTYLPFSDTRPALLHHAMRYSMQAGGKRLRPILLLIAHHIFTKNSFIENGSNSPCQNSHNPLNMHLSTDKKESHIDPLPAAVAVECLHSYSLIHDDLPCMDNSDLRRGIPTCHKQFGEATALLAGDALLSQAFILLAQHYSNTPSIGMRLIQELAMTSGSRHLIAGQVEDLYAQENISESDIEFIHNNKTAALIATSLKMGALLGEASEVDFKHIDPIGKAIGLAFQIIDDILDQTQDTNTIGKPAGLDSKNQKKTYLALYGMDYSRQKVHELTQLALNTCSLLNGDAGFLCDFIRYLENRIC